MKSHGKPVVSAIITTYQRHELCKRAVNSVLDQTYEDIELTVVEDGSNSGIDSWLDKKISDAEYVKHEENRGLAAARNTGIEHTTGELVAFLDDDDGWKPTKIEKQVEKINSLSDRVKRNLGVVYCGIERRTPEGDLKSVGRTENEGFLNESIKRKGASTNPSSFLFPRQAIQDVGGFDESLPSSIDHDIWMKLATHG
ncbi:MAG: glycosyltransferase family 2 protein, partial [Halobacteria archaeon]